MSPEQKKQIAKERRERILNTIGFALLGLCFLAAAGRVLLRAKRESDPNLITIRFSHWQLEGGVRDGLDHLAREYEAICAARGQKVRVEQAPVPERVYSNWFITQLIGGTAPDLVEINSAGTDERLSRFFEPLTSALSVPNPYNKGTDLENVAWRNTFVDGLDSIYRPELLEYYAVPFTVVTLRVFYNKALYKEIMGDAPLPKSYGEFVQLCEEIKRRRPDVTPISGSKYNGPMMIGQLFSSQTQKLALQFNRSLTLKSDPTEVSLAYLRGKWNIHTPEVESGLKLIQSASKQMPQGFMELSREDATMTFVQKRAVMINTGTWDRTSIISQCDFAVDAFRLPFPDKTDPDYGKGVLGPLSEATFNLGGGFALNRASEHPEVALDFLRFLTSRKSSETFSELSGWLPVIVGAKNPDSINSFLPDITGYVPGFNLNDSGGESNRLWSNTFYLLTSQDTPVPFQQAMDRDLRERYLADLALAQRDRIRTIDRKEPVLAARWWLAQSKDQTAEAGRVMSDADKLSELLETQNATENAQYRLQGEVDSVQK